MKKIFLNSVASVGKMGPTLVITGKDFERCIRQATATARAMYACDLETGYRGLFPMTPTQARLVTHCSQGYQMTARRLDEEQRDRIYRNLATLADFHKGIGSDTEVAQVMQRIGPDRLLRAIGPDQILRMLDVMTAPAVVAA